MNFLQFVDDAEKKLGYRTTKITGLSNAAKPMEGCIFLGGPNLQNLDGTKPYALCSKISFGPATQLYFCLNFGNKTAQLSSAVRSITGAINNCKFVIDSVGLFVTTKPVNSDGVFVFTPPDDIRVDAESFFYYEEGDDSGLVSTIQWITKNFTGQIVSLGKSTPAVTQVSNSVKHPLNQILFGPPGTGKTYNAINHAIAIVRNCTVREILDEEKSDPKSRIKVKKEFDELIKQGQISFVTFHQSYSYEEFVEGLKPVANENAEIEYKIIDGIFKKICLQALKVELFDFDDIYDDYTDDLKKNPNQGLKTIKQGKDFGVSLDGERIIVKIASTGREVIVSKNAIRDYLEKNLLPAWWPSYIKAIGENIKTKYKSSIASIDNKTKNFVIIIDEINRGNISKIFGELITLIESSKRIGEPEQISLKLAYSGTEENSLLFGVPNNIYILGTMNTTDRSIALIDTALRRRFTFVEQRPEPSLLPVFDGIDLSLLLATINSRIEFLLDQDHLIGHAYFINCKSKNDLCDVFRNKIIPLLQEYFYNDFSKIQYIFGDNRSWKKADNFKIIQEKDGSGARDLFGVNDIEGFEEKVIYKIMDEIANEEFEKVDPTVFISIYQNAQSDT